MSHIKQKTTRKNRSNRIFIIGSLFILLFTLFDVMTMTANAATATGTTHRSNPTKIMKSNLVALSGTKDIVLDWQTQSYNINFDLPTHDWYEALDLFISATPEGRVSKRTPLLISFNGADPVAINGRGSRFDAHIRLDNSRIRTTNNSLKITYQTPSDADCLTQSHGKWNIDLARSKLVATTRAKTRNLYISEIEPRLLHAMTTPKRVAIIAKGTHKVTLEAILAQGIAQRTHALPSFQFTAGRSDFTVLIGTNRQLYPLVKNKSLLNKTSPSIFVDAGVRPKLVLSAPNDEQLIELARAFSSFHLPSQQRADISLFDLYSSNRLIPRATLGAKRYQLGEIGDVSLSPSWHATPAHVLFNVEDSRSSTGILTLNISVAKTMHPDSRLKLSLNDKSLGFTKLDKTNKAVAFDIPAGSFQPSANKLVFTPELVSKSSNNTCSLAANIPAILVSANSKLEFINTAQTPIADLSRLAGNGSLFNGEDGNAALILTARTAQERAATLHFLGYAARQFGPKWVGASYYTALPPRAELNQNILIIGPKTPLDSKLLSKAPRALKLAMNGTVFKGPRSATTAKPERHASNDSHQAFLIAARKTGLPARIRSGGIASIFPSPYAKGKLIGVVSATTPAHYNRAMRSVSTDKYWNALRGSVTRWNNTSILMAQTSKPAPFGFFPEKPKASPLEKLQITSFTDMKTKFGQWVSGIKFHKPQFAENRTASPKHNLPKLRGAAANAIPTPNLKRKFVSVIAPKPSAQYASSVTFSSIQTSLTSRFNQLKSGIEDMRSTGFTLQTAEGLLDNVKRNRLAWMLILAVIGFFLLALASPKEA